MNEIPEDRIGGAINPNAWLDAAGKIVFDIVAGDLVTLLDPDASDTEKTVALAMMIPTIKLAKIPKLAEDIKDCIDLADEVKDTADHVKDAAKGVSKASSESRSASLREIKRQLDIPMS